MLTGTLQNRCVPSLEQGVFLNLDEDVEIARRAAAQPGIALAGQTDPRPGLDPGRDVDRQLPLALDPAAPNKILSGSTAPLPTAADSVGLRLVDSILSSQIYVENLHRIAAGKDSDRTLSRAWTFAHAMWMVQGWSSPDSIA